MCSLSYHSLNSASSSGRDVHGVQEQTAGAGGRELVAGEYLIALEAHQPLDAARDALGPRREILSADGQVRRALEDGHAVEIVGGDGDLAVLRSDPALTGEKPGTRWRSGRCSVSYQSWNSSSATCAMCMAAISVPFAIVLLLPARGGYCIIPLSVSHRWMSWATWSEFLSIIIMWPLPVTPSLGSSHQSATPPSARRASA